MYIAKRNCRRNTAACRISIFDFRKTPPYAMHTGGAFFTVWISSERILAEWSSRRLHTEALAATSSSSSSARYSMHCSSENRRRYEADGGVGAGCAHIGRAAFSADVDGHVLVAVALADDHTGIDLHARPDEHRAAILHAADAGGGRLTRLKRDERAGQTRGDLALTGA